VMIWDMVSWDSLMALMKPWIWTRAFVSRRDYHTQVRISNYLKEATSPYTSTWSVPTHPLDQSL
jgi:hypothetical protein